MNPPPRRRRRGLVENEEQGKNKKMKSIVVEEQEQEQEQEEGSESGFVFDLDEDMLHNVLKRVDMVTLGRAECVNKLWGKVARDERLWGPIATRIYASFGSIDKFIFQFCMKKVMCLPKKKKVRSSTA